MINKVSLSQAVPAFKQDGGANKQSDMLKSTKRKQFTDSFVKHAADSTPMILSLTALLTVLDCGNKKLTLSKALGNNLKQFFLPVLIISSAVLALLENRKVNKNSK